MAGEAVVKVGSLDKFVFAFGEWASGGSCSAALLHAVFTQLMRGQREYNRSMNESEKQKNPFEN